MLMYHYKDNFMSKDKNGKGDKRRPSNHKLYRKNWDKIFNKKKTKK